MHKGVFLGIVGGSVLAVAQEWQATLSWPLWSLFVAYYGLAAFSFTAGYHRLWSHRSFVPVRFFEYFLGLFSTATFAGQPSSWAKLHLEQHHQQHHPHTTLTTLWNAHLQWTFLTQLPTLSSSSTSKSSKSSSSSSSSFSSSTTTLPNSSVREWVDQHYWWLSVVSGLVLPTIVGGLVTGNWVASLLWLGCVRSLVQNQLSTLLHTLPLLGLVRKPYDNSAGSLGDSFLLALVSLGDGFQNFHMLFPEDFRSGVRKYHWDPTKWILQLLALLGLVTELKRTPRKEWMRARLETTKKSIEQQLTQVDSLLGTKEEEVLPTYSWSHIRQHIQQHGKQWIVIDGLVFDVAQFLSQHPGGKKIIIDHIGTDATLQFNGEVYRHSKAARNLLGPLRIARLDPSEPSPVEPLQ